MRSQVARVRRRVSRTVRRAPSPRKAHAAAVAQHFRHLDPGVVDQFFENFGFTMPLSLLDKLQRICASERPELVVEFGAGVSTTVLQRAVSGHGGFLLSVENEATWVAATHERLPASADIAFLCAPGLTEAARINYPAVGRLLGDLRAGLLVIDGPAHGERFSAEALALYERLLSPASFVAIDDTDREHEDGGAVALASRVGLDKHDFGDPLFPRHRYSVLAPRGREVPQG